MILPTVSEKIETAIINEAGTKKLKILDEKQLKMSG